MHRRARGYTFILLQLVTDLLAVAVGLSLAYWLRFDSGWIPVRDGNGSVRSWDPASYASLFPIAIALWGIALGLTHNYTNHPLAISFNKARRLFKGSMLALALIVAYTYFSRSILEFSRILFPISLVVVLGCLLLGRTLLQHVILTLFRGGVARTRVLLVGTGEIARRIAIRARAHPEYGYELAGYVADAPEAVGNVIEGVPVVGSVEDLADLIPRHNIHEVFITHSTLPPADYLRIALDSEREVAQIRVVPNMAEIMMGEVVYDELAGIPLFSIKETPLHGWNAALKRLIDIVLSGAALAVLGIPILVIAWLVKRDSPGPAFYRQRRVGVDGRPFEILKFRSMRIDAEKTGAVWGGRVDDRCTRLGRWLRTWDIDELPQLWNIFRGDLSIVGPRPERPEFIKEFKLEYPRYMARLKVRAGLTGWAQVHGLRGNTPIDLRVQYDIYYIENWTFWLDMKIIIMTLLQLGKIHTAKAIVPPSVGAADQPTPAAPPHPPRVATPE